jgi:hypothetical protein
MTGKFILITIMIAVATGLILGFQSDISSSINSILGGESNDPEGAETMEISNDQPVQEIASLVDSCYNRYLENSLEDYVCFIASADSEISFSGSGLENSLSEEVNKVTEISSDYNSNTIVIRYSSDRGKIVVE